MIPVLETERLILRGPEASDFDASAAMWADERVVKHISGTPTPRPESWRRLLTHIGHWQAMNFGYWVVVEKSTGLFVGEIGFADFQREMEPSIKGSMEAGWVTSPDFHGRGYATEAVQAAIDWAHKNFPEKTITCIICTGARSLYQRCPQNGFHRAMHRPI